MRVPPGTYLHPLASIFNKPKGNYCLSRFPSASRCYLSAGYYQSSAGSIVGPRRTLSSAATKEDHLPPAVAAQCDEISRRLKGKKRVLFVTGAGLSADSGLPTYRGVSGLYNSGMTEDGVSIEEAISGDMLRVAPAISWKYLAQIEEGTRSADCNAGHEAIRDFERYFKVVVLSQNIDSFHTRAGSSDVIDIHGDLNNLECTKCGDTQKVKDYSHLSYLRMGETDRTLHPKCTKCGGLIRPQVVLFGEMLDTAKLGRLQNELKKGFDAVFTVGTTSVFPYIAAPVQMAARGGNLTVEINPSETEVSHLVEFKIEHGAASVLTRIVEGLGTVTTDSSD